MDEAPLRYAKNGMPVLNSAEIDRLGEQIAGDFCVEAMKSPMQIDVDRFVRQYLGMELDFHYLSHSGLYLGMTVFGDCDCIPVYNPEQNRAEFISARAGTVIIDGELLAAAQQARYRFTMGHEGGHVILHSKFYNCNPALTDVYGSACPVAIKCRRETAHDVRKPYCRWTDNDWMEWQANKFSAAFLMPRAMVFVLVAKYPNRKMPLCDYWNYLTGKVKRSFGVSCTAAGYRLKDLGVIPRNAHIVPDSVDFYQYYTA